MRGRPPQENRSCCWIKIELHGDQLLIGRGLTALERAEALQRERGVARSIAACHAAARTAEETNWIPHCSSVSGPGQLNLAYCGAESSGGGGHGLRPQAGLELVDALAGKGADRLPSLPTERGDLLAKLGRLRKPGRRLRARQL